MDRKSGTPAHGTTKGVFARLQAHRTLVMCLLLVILAGASGTVLSSCYTNPATGKESLSLYSTEQEVQMGRQAHEAIQAQLGLVNDSSLQQYVSNIGQRLAALTNRPDLPWTFRVVDDPTVNAFALPGGFIYITRGMLVHMENEAELAGVIGHEIGHVTARHSVNQMSKQQLTQLGLIGATLIEPRVQEYGQIIGAGLGLLFLKYSRDDERESDLLGFRYMYQGGYDPRQMDDVFQTLARIGDRSGGGAVPSWLSTHPAPEDRVERIQGMVDTLPGDLSGRTVAREEYLRHIDGLVFGQDPREGYFEGQTFYHPQMRFQITFPPEWQTVNQKQAVAGISPEQNAIVQIGASPASSPTEAARQFLTQQGISGGVPQQTSLNGISAVQVSFSAQSEQSGTLVGTGTFVAQNGTILQILGYAPEGNWSQYQSVVSRAVGSFGPLTEQSRINVEPQRLELVTIDQAMTIQQFNERYPSPIPIEELAILNQVELNEQISRGTVIKRVVGPNLRS